MSITSVINDTVTSVSLVNAQKPLPPTISGYSVGGLDDTALDPAGGQTVQINGTGFLPGATITFDGSAVAVVTFSSANRLTFTSPAKSAGTYTIYVVNPDGGTAIYIPGIIYSVLPTWTTSAGTLGSYYETQSISNTVVASGDAPITYSLYSGSLPTGSTLSSGGVITGTAPVDSGSTTYSFTIQATDAQLQDSTRSFSLTINTDVVTWVSPANATTYTSAVDSAIANVTLSATDAAGYAVTYSANALPTGLSLSGANISGTPTVIADSSTLLTATAATTNRTATRTINWSITVANDPYFEYNTLLIPGASTTFVDDASTNNFAVTIAGDTKPNSFNPYSPGYYSNFFQAGAGYTSGNGLSVAANSAFAFGTGDFTVEFWTRPPAFGSGSSTAPTMVAVHNGATDSGWQLYWNDGYIGIRTYYSNVMYLNADMTGYLNKWSHIAYVRYNGTQKIYINGVEQCSTSTVWNWTDNIVGIAQTAQYYTGNISNLRMIKGTALYTSAFTPPTSPLTAVSGTSLLTCQSNRFIDNSTNNFTITLVNSPTISSAQPFTPNSSYSTYGSGYFDGSGDYLSVANNTATNLGTGDFTIEFWLNANATQPGSNPRLLSTDVWNTSAGYDIDIEGSLIQFRSGGGVSKSCSFTTSDYSVWNHIAFSRSGTTFRVFKNGVLANTYTDSSNLTSANPTYIAKYAAATGSDFAGYMTDVRVVKGSAVYTTSFTPPSAPLTAVANTSLLTLQNNQSVNNSVFLDNSSNNFLVTRAGNATQGTFSPYGGNWSNYFDGNGDYLSVPSLATQATQFTIEFWAYFTNADGGRFDFFSLGGSAVLYRPASNTLNWYIGADRISGSFTLASYGNKWNHIAICRDASNNTRLFVNGTQLGSTYTSDTNSYTSTGPAIGWNSGGGYLNGYISNFRVVNGTALYTTTFTPPTTPLTPITNTSLLTCQSNRLIDSSINNYTITKNGDTSVQRFSPFNPASLTPTSYSGYFDGTGDYLSIADSTNIQPGSGDLTYEFWWYPTTFAPSYQEILTKGTGLQIYAQAAGPYLVVALSADNSGSYFINNGPSTALSTNTWYHIAVTRSGNNYYVYLNGVQTLLGTSASSIGTGTDALLIGAYKGPLYYTTGYISNVRFVKGTAVYTSNFTPPTSPLTAISGTQLLTCQSTTFIDNSTNNFTITAAGDSKPSIQNPFGYSSATTNGYSVSTIGGSGYFDGSGDYLTLAANSSLTITAGPSFTMEAWIYPVTNSESNPIIASQDYGGGDNQCFQFRIVTSNNTLQFLYWTSSARASVVAVTTSNAITLNQWNHVAVSWTGTTLYLFINGVVGFSGAVSTMYGATNNPTSIGILSTGNLTAYFKGYISDLRMIKGQALYTSNFVPPSQPLSAVQNTVLLTNMTSAGIYDASMMNDMESVGDAKLSTAVSKFGGSSMYFDGTGDSFKGISASPSFQFGTGDFTVECWVYTSNLSSYQTLIDTRSADTQSAYGLFINNSAFPAWYDASGFATSSVAVSSNTWTHVAVSRSSGTLKVFVNGTSGYSGSNTNAQNPTGNIVVGMNISGSAPYNGYIDDLRITKGYARYTSNFSVPTSAFPIY